jgi:hypothetical protein
MTKCNPHYIDAESKAEKQVSVRMSAFGPDRLLDLLEKF